GGGAYHRRPQATPLAVLRGELAESRSRQPRCPVRFRGNRGPNAAAPDWHELTRKEKLDRARQPWIREKHGAATGVESYVVRDITRKHRRQITGSRLPNTGGLTNGCSIGKRRRQESGQARIAEGMFHLVYGQQ